MSGNDKGSDNGFRFSDGEWKLMDLLWEKEPRTIGEMVEALKEDTSWNKSTIFMMLKRLLEKGAVRVETGGRCQLYYPMVLREEASLRETESFLSKVYRGSIGMMISSMAGQKKLSEDEIEELYAILRNAQEDVSKDNDTSTASDTEKEG